jgi:hypothetical protein
LAGTADLFWFSRCHVLIFRGSVWLFIGSRGTGWAPGPGGWGRNDFRRHHSSRVAQGDEWSAMFILPTGFP